MNDIPRYRPVANDRYGITDDADGKLCEYRDYARLKAEVERLTNCKSEADRLKAEVDRLRKAGDAMAEAMWYGDAERSIWVKKFAETEWHAAKEGKQP